MIHKGLEEWWDTLLYLGVLLGCTILFIGRWNSELKVRYAEAVMQEFLTEVAVSGKIKREYYEQLVNTLERIENTYRTEITCTEYILEPVYAPLTEGIISENSLFTGRVSETAVQTSAKELLFLLDMCEEKLLNAGDFVTLCLWENQKQRALLQCKIRTDGRGR